MMTLMWMFSPILGLGSQFVDEDPREGAWGLLLYIAAFFCLGILLIWVAGIVGFWKALAEVLTEAFKAIAGVFS